MKLYNILIVVLALLCSCVKDPNQVVAPDPNANAKQAALILCEGLWGSNNSVLDRFVFDNSVFESDFFQTANNMKLGDLGFDIVVKGDSAFISVTTSSNIFVIDCKSGKVVGNILLPANSAPRKIVIVNDTCAFVSLLYKKQIAEFNPRTFELKASNINVGPYPEGICSDGSRVYVANSGFGDLYYKMEKAGTLSVVDINSRSEIKYINVGNNPIETIVNRKTNKLYVCWYNLPSLKDSLGGISEFDLNTLALTRQWRTRATDICFSQTGDTLFYINGNADGVEGIAMINLNNSEPLPSLFITNPDRKNILYALSVSPDGNKLWVGNAKNFAVSGEILVYNIAGKSIEKTYSCGMNPNSIVFY